MALIGRGRLDAKLIAALIAVATVAAVLATDARAVKDDLDLVSRASGAAGAKGDNTSVRASTSADGRFVAFQSDASNLHPDDTDGTSDIFVRDLQANTTTLVSRASGAAGAKGTSGSFNPSISADGRFVAFNSFASNLHPDDTDGTADIFVRDLQSNTTTLVSRASGAAGAKGNDASFNPSISADGRFVAFQSQASNLHPDDTDPNDDIFVRDLQSNTTTLVSRASGAAGVKGNFFSFNPSISADGRFVAFESNANNLHPDDTDGTPDIFVRDLQSNTTTLVSRASGAAGVKGNSLSVLPSISADGRFVAFDSNASNLHPDDTDTISDIFVRDLQSNTTALVSRVSGAAGAKGNGSSIRASISADGRFVAFDSSASNLHPDDTDGTRDVFRRTIGLDPPVNLSPPELSGQPVVGRTLECSDGEWTDGTITRVWRRGGTEIPGATDSTYTPTDDDVGRRIDCLVTATNADGSAFESSESNLVFEPLSGPEGPQGPEGPLGPQGPEGPTGTDGADGSPGSGLSFSPVHVIRRPKRGRATLVVEVREPGELVLRGKRVRNQRASVDRHRLVRLDVLPRGAARQALSKRSLRRSGARRVSTVIYPNLHFLPEGGERQTRRVAVRIVRRG